MMQDYEIINADCLRAMQEMPDGSVDAIVTDPPYGLSFMGKEWDSFGYGSKVQKSMAAFQAAMTPIFEEALRVAKPGAHLLCFGGTRTFHRMTCAIEDAGWEIRDSILWVWSYGQGFPKSMDVGKAIDKALGKKREKVGERPEWKVSRKWREAEGRSDLPTSMLDITEPASNEAKIWDGWGTCLKPAWEPIIVARKPLEGTVAHNVMTYGTGAINIDGCRVPTDDKLGGGMRAGGADGVWDRPFMHDEKAQADFVERKKANVAKSESLGRFPANLVHDGSQEVLELFPDTGKSSGGGGKPSKNGGVIYGTYSEMQRPKQLGLGDSGSAARFFYCAKASKRDRGEGNDHPTVKPNALMRWLVRLVCPQGGTVLDPFMGSGSTGVACIQEGMRFVGIDMDEHYCEIANTRISKEADTVFCENQ